MHFGGFPSPAFVFAQLPRLCHPPCSTGWSRFLLRPKIAEVECRSEPWTLCWRSDLGLVPGLKASDQRVATVLLEHFNRRTGQCDPGLTRISELLGISVRTVIRSNSRLEASGLFRKVRHGGYGNRNSYQPVWSRFTEYQALWQAKMQYKSKSRVPDVSPAS